VNALPAVGAVVERLRLDCKLRYDLDDVREMAKDVAAFANANGGRLLIGSKEAAGVIQVHKGLTVDEATQTKRAVDEAVRNWLTPRPVIDFPEPFMLDDGNVVLIVDVQPYPGQPVGLQIDKGDKASWKFPVRVGTNTVWYDPVEIVMLMDVAHRRKVQLLNAAHGSLIDVRHAGTHGRSVSDLSRLIELVRIVDIDDRSNAIQLKVLETERIAEDLRKINPAALVIWLSIDCIESVWRNGARWTLELNGTLELAGWANTVPTFIRPNRI